MKPALLLTLLALACTGAELPSETVARLKAKYDAELAQAAVAWLNSADLAAVPQPALKDPRASEREENEEKTVLNGLLEEARAHKLALAKKTEKPSDVAQWFAGQVAFPHMQELYAKYKGSVARKP